MSSAMFSRSAQYAIRAMTFLARQPAGKLSGAREISETEDIPMPFLWKILQNLARRKLVRSYKGVRGGYQLARPAADISVHDIVQATDDARVTDGCILGLPECNPDAPCPLHSSWMDLRDRIGDMLDRSTLADLAQATSPEKKASRPRG